MFIRTRKAITLTTLISGLFLVISAQAWAKEAVDTDTSDITIEPISERPAPATATPSSKTVVKAPTATPTKSVAAKVKVPTNTPTSTKTATPRPTSTPTKTLPTSTPVKIAATPTNTPQPKKTTPTPTPTKVIIKATPTPTTRVNTGTDPGAQFSLSLDALGQGLFHQTKTTSNSYFGVGGQIFADWRPIQYVSFGLGGQYSYFPGSSFSLSTLDFGGRFFPIHIEENPVGEFYLQGGLGFGLTHQAPASGNYHGYAGFGYRVFLSQSMALDTGAQYDLYSPLNSPTHGIGVKLGLTFLFGRTKWPVAGEDQDVNGGSGSKNNYQAGSPFYKWQAGDTLKTVAARVFNDPFLYPILVDSNKGLFLYPDRIKPGVEIKVTALNFTDDQLESYREKGLHDAHYLSLLKASARFGYESVKNWKGPSRYRWKKYDTFSSIAEKIYGDEDLYPLLVDANEKRLIHPSNLRPGIVLVVPPPPVEDWVEIVHQWAWSKDPYIWWKAASEDSGDQKP